MEMVAGMDGDKGTLSDLVIDVDLKLLNVYRDWDRRKAVTFESKN